MPCLLLEGKSICNAKKILQSKAFPSLIVHRLSISTPSIVHRNYGVSMEYVWSIYGVSSEDGQRICLFPLEIHAFYYWGENDKKEKRKSPRRQGFIMNCLREWGLFILWVCLNIYFQYDSVYSSLQNGYSVPPPQESSIRNILGGISLEKSISVKG